MLKELLAKVKKSADAVSSWNIRPKALFLSSLLSSVGWQNNACPI